MKKLFTIDDIMAAFVSAMGYGFTMTISKIFGWPKLVCYAACFVVGILSEQIVNRVIFSETVQKNRRNRILAFAGCFLVFVAAHVISLVLLETSLFDYLGEQFVYVIGLPILGFFVNLVIRWFRVRKIRGLYGDGSRGFVFDLNAKDVAETNKQNQPITGAYDTDCAVRTRTGIYVGQKHFDLEKFKGTVCYLGIPYAKPPVGERRWKAPEELPASEVVYEAKYFGASAVQVEHEGSIIRYHRQSEDCLTLNVFAGSKRTESGKPVLVLFHHGDFSCGGSVDPLLHGKNFAAAHPDIVFVSFNYRLGIFGFIDFSEIPGGEVCPDTLNLGLLDQVAALKWIRENIAAFGGDPDRITVLGFESGATSILLLAAGGLAEGLFQKAFVFNGSPLSAYDTPETSRALAKDLLKETRTETMEELLRLDTETLKKAAQKLWRDLCAPTCDGIRFPADVYRALREGAASDIGFVVGFPGDETRVVRARIGGRKYEELLSAAAAEMRKTMEDSASWEGDGREAEAKLVRQGLALCIYRTAAVLAQGGSRVHMMYWDEKPLLENLGSGTVDAAAALLGNDDALQMYGSVMTEDLSETLGALLAKFVKGDALELYPNEIRRVDAVEWKTFPKALVVSDGELRCDRIEDSIQERMGREWMPGGKNDGMGS